MDAEWQVLAYKTIEEMRPGKKFTHRLLIGMVGFPQGERPMFHDADAMNVIVKADVDELIYLSGVKEPSHRGGPMFVWTRYDDEDEDAEP
jgi:hypothetical protein